MAVDHADLAKQLEAFISNEVPALSGQDIHVHSYDGQSLSLKAPLAKHINDKATAFGGSLYGVSVLCGWGVMYLLTKEHGIDGSIVVAKGEIDYLKPSKTDLVATVSVPSYNEIQHFLTTFERRGRAALSLSGCIYNENNEKAVQFNGRYAVTRL